MAATVAAAEKVELGVVIDVEAVVGAGRDTEGGAAGIEVMNVDTEAVAEAGGTDLGAVIGATAVNVPGTTVLGDVIHAVRVAVPDTKKRALSGNLNLI